MVYLVPLIWLRRTATLAQAWLFLERNGTHLMELETAPTTAEEATKAAREFLEMNELEGGGEPFLAGDCLFVPVDASDKDLKNFYTWRETPVGTTPMREVWRPFLWVEAADGSDGWGVNRFLKDIPVGPTHSAYSVLSSYRETLRLTTKND